MARQEQQIFESTVQVRAAGRLIGLRAAFHQPGGTFILAVEQLSGTEEQKIVAELVAQLERANSFQKPVTLRNQICFVPRQREPDYIEFLRRLTQIVIVEAHRPWKFN